MLTCFIIDSIQPFVFCSYLPTQWTIFLDLCLRSKTRLDNQLQELLDPGHRRRAAGEHPHQERPQERPVAEEVPAVQQRGLQMNRVWSRASNEGPHKGS